jgi:tetratricopeptide (TPR) repeat protein/tRNA A-37 threonylcarbamoyl transferase component Bud32
MSSDRNLLFGIVAVQMNFISRDALIEAMNAWILEKDRTLGDILFKQGRLTTERRQLLEALVNEHLKAHGNDPQRSLAALSQSSVAPIAQSLRKVADADLQQSLGGLPEQTHAETTVFTPREAGHRFRVIRPHAHGGLGEVYIAEDMELHREVALKEIQAQHADNPNSRGRFLMEAEVTGGLEHPGIVPVYGLGTYADGRPFYAMRFIRGDSLKEAIERFHRPPGGVQGAGFDSLAFRQLLRRFQDVCNAIAYAHSRGILHRDLKPGNIMLGMYGETLVVDWGLAKPIGRDRSAAPAADVERTLQPVSGSGYVETQMGSIIGTPGYMSPEQASGRLEDLGPASDIYSLGATLYVLLTGQPPFQGSVPEVLKKVAAGDYPPPRQVRADVPQALNGIVLKAMAIKREDRYATATALADEIDRFLADEPVTAFREPFGIRARRWARKHRTLVTSGAAAALVLLAAAIAGTIVLGDKNRLLAQTNDRLDAANAELKRTNADLDLAKKDADAKRDLAERARETTAEQRQLALDTVRDVLFRVDQLMKRDTRLIPLRLEIVRRMLDDVDRIREHALKNPLTDRTEGTAFERIGDIYFKSNRIEDAVLWLTKAHGVFKALSDERPDDQAYLRNLAGICHSLAEAEWRFGHGTRSRALHAEGLRLNLKRRSLLDAMGSEMDRSDADQQIAESYANVAYTDLRLGDPKSAIENYRAADAAFEKLPPPLPNWLQNRRIRNEIHVRLGDAQSKLRQNDQALKYYKQALEDRESQMRLSRDRDPSMALLKGDVGQSRMYLGDFYLMIQRDFKAADEQYRLALELLSEGLANEPDSLDLQQRVAATHYRLGVTATHNGGLAPLAGGISAVAHFAICLDMREKLARIDPKDTQGQVEVLLAYARLGQIAEVERTANRILEQAGTDPQSLFQTVCGFGICAGGKDEAAARCRERAFEVMQKLLESGWKDPVALETDPDLEAIRGDKRFAELIKKFK